jgi:ArsR family transcriptional regulator
LKLQQEFELKSIMVDGCCLLGHMVLTGIASEQALQLLRVLAEPIRLQLVQCLGSGERCVCELTSELGLAQSKLSFHLKVMKDAGLITARQQGRWCYYRLAPQALIWLSNWLDQLTVSCNLSALPCS